MLGELKLKCTAATHIQKKKIKPNEKGEKKSLPSCECEYDEQFCPVYGFWTRLRRRGGEGSGGLAKKLNWGEFRCKGGVVGWSEERRAKEKCTTFLKCEFLLLLCLCSRRS